MTDRPAPQISSPATDTPPLRTFTAATNAPSPHTSTPSANTPAPCASTPSANTLAPSTATPSVNTSPPRRPTPTGATGPGATGPGATGPSIPGGSTGPSGIGASGPTGIGASGPGTNNEGTSGPDTDTAGYTPSTATDTLTPHTSSTPADIPIPHTPSTATNAPIPHTSPTATDTSIPHTPATTTNTPPPRSTPAALWDPGTAIDPKIWRQIGLDPTTTTNTLGGAEPPYGFRLYSGHDTTRMYSITIWSQIYTVEDFRRKESDAIFIPITIGTRTGFRYAPAADTTGDHCTLIFPAPHGSCSIQLIRQSTRAPMPPTDKAIRIARLIVPLFPM